MSNAQLANLRKQCGGPRDGALLRFSLGSALLTEGEHAAAIEELRKATEFDPTYSAAWKLLGKACQASGDDGAAAAAWHSGIAAAAQRGDKQAEKEMTVFLRRLS
ncbi:tetratricopeptide repeat protein [Rhodanobacter sp. AS-Z3]|uniref:tetratricopeptide repeat protein n=1 Tax=Rhodanobacter sp. AS-Z3 TaxID=3031330 RepID=UPI002479909A|nr:tetratricopeptide repeat protein [Rhodanobacter sp. AS-Z3]WEN15737.1 tetratricopeptide repeat protein [Rhodanobacter sp. AS-Z3]